MFEIEKILSQKVNALTEVVKMYNDFPEDVRSSNMWIQVQSYNIGILHSLRSMQEIITDQISNLPDPKDLE